MDLIMYFYDFSFGKKIHSKAICFLG